MKYLKHLICMVMMLFLLLPGAAASESKGEGVNLQEILWGHIKDSYEWHVTNIGDKPIIINLPVIVKTSNGWYMGWAEDFAEEPLESGPHAGYRPCKNNPDLFIATKGNYERRIVEIQKDGTEVRPFDISITKSVCVLFIDAIILMLCILIPARWCRRHKVTDKAPKGFTGLMHMFVMYVYDEVIKPTLGKESDRYAPYLLTCFFFIFVANIMGIVPFPLYQKSSFYFHPQYQSSLGILLHLNLFVLSFLYLHLIQRMMYMFHLSIQIFRPTFFPIFPHIPGNLSIKYV